MLPSLPFGPLSLPTGPIFALIAVFIALDLAGRYGRRFAIHPDDIWNTGMLGVAAGLIVARLWNVFQFWPIYRTEPLLIFSLRPSGFEFWPGVMAALVGAYAYLLWRALPPLPVGAALAVGMVAGGVLLEVSGHLTGDILGLPTTMPWAANYFGQSLHPVGLYRAIGLIILILVLWPSGTSGRPGRTILLAALGYSLIRLVADGFQAQAPLVGVFRLSQVVALLVALGVTLLLSREHAATERAATERAATEKTVAADPTPARSAPSQPEPPES